jgi:hypothetical protein
MATAVAQQAILTRTSGETPMTEIPDYPGLVLIQMMNRLQTPPCDATAKATCEVGDLAGKYGAGNETYIQKA